jgi:hypothetical protein
MEPATALEAATTEVTAAAAATTTVPSRPYYGTERHGRDANYQINYLFYFHTLTFGRALSGSHCASAGFRGVP